MAAQGLQLPISIQIQNLQDVAAQLKKLASSNVLSDSLGGKKIDAELTKVLHTLAQIELRSKNAFKTEGDFSSLEKDINKVELSIDRIKTGFSGLKFDELKIPTDVQDQLTALNAQIAALKNNFSAFKAAQKDKLLENVDFTGNLSKAFGKDAAGMMTKNYDEMYAAIERGMARINAKLLAAKAEFQMNSQLVTQNAPGKAKFSAWGALDFLEQAFKSLPTDQSKYTKQQEMLAKYMQIGTINSETGEQGFTKFNNGGAATQFFHQLAQMYELTPAQLEEIRKRVTEAAKNANTTAGEALRAAATDRAKGAEIFGGKGMSYDALLAGKQQYESQVKTAQDSGVHVDQVQAQVDAASAAWRSLQAVQEEVAASQRVLDDALKAPTASLTELQNAVVSSVANMPQLGQAFSQAAAQIYQLRQAADAGRAQLVSLDQTLGKLQGVSNFVNRYVGIYAIVRKVSQAVRNAFQNIKDLDKNITNIAVVTNMSQEDLWGKIGEYTEMAQQYGVATKDVYTVSQLFYQQGLQTNQVMSLTTETLKMAKISGMGYEEAANAMTVAIRAFRIEMTDAQSVTDTYSALAAKFAVSSQEIANAMEKTASSAANVGMSLESTSAFISVMTQTTRESAQNIGSALKSIISRYGEMKASPTSLLNVDGEDVAFNKVDTALKSVGISIKDASGQFRDFDDVIMELAAKWDTLDNNTQRYIATVMAGNRQQSRFIALVSNYDELSRAMDTANNSQNASIVQTAKTMDSLESKAQQLKNAFSQVYLDLHIEDGLKSAYDWLTRILKTVGKLGVLKGVLPTLANVIGIGTGTKKLVNYAKEGVMDHRRNLEKTVNLKDEEAKQKAQELQAMLEKEANKKVTIQADLSQLQSAQASVEASVNATGMKAANMLVGMGAGRNGMTYTPTEMMGIMGRAQEKGLFSTPEGREKFLTHMGVDPNSESGGQLNALLESFNTLAGQAAQLGVALQGATNSANNAAGADDKKTGSAEGAANADERKTRAAEGATGADDKKTGSAEGAAQADQEKITPAKGAALSDQGKIVPAAGAALVDGKKTVEGEQAAGADERKVPAAEGAAQSDRDKVGPAEAAAAADRLKAQGGAPTGGTPTGGKVPPGNNTPTTKTSPWEGHETAMKVVGVASGVARLAGTAITAAGAAHKDTFGESFLGYKGTNGNGVELSKMYTGLGNGLSMAGTGASIGMAFGPWGALVGAIGGFLVGGLGSILDSLEMTTAEKVKLLQEKNTKAQEESLKQQAKATDMSTSIDNLKQLRKAMYNSSEDMKAYKDAMNTMTEQYPDLVSSYDEAGNAIIDLNAAEAALAQIRLQGANAAREAAITEGDLYEGYAQGLREAYAEAKKAKAGKSTSTYQGTDKASWDSTKVFTLTMDDGTVRQFGSSYYHLDSNGTNNTAHVTDYRYATAIATAANELLGKKFTSGDDVSQLSYDELQQVVAALKENPEIGKYATAYDIWGNALYSTIPKEVWERYEQYYFREAPVTSYTYSDLTALNAQVAAYSELFGGKTTARQLIDIDDETVELTEAQMEKIRAIIDNTIEKTDLALGKLRKSSGYAINSSQLQSTALMSSELSATDLNRIQSGGIYSRLFSEMMEQYTQDNTEYDDVLAWYHANQSEFQTAASTQATEFINWYNTLTNVQKDTLESLDFTEYRSADEVLAKLGLSKDTIDASIYDAFVDQFIESNKNNRERLLNTIWGTDGELNTNLTGILKLDANHKELVQQIADQFAADANGASNIISEYADWFTTQIVAINSLAEAGYTELASTRIEALEKLSSELAGLNDEQVQKDLFKTITSIDFSSYSSITTAYKAIEEYGKKNNKSDVVAPLLAQLKQAESSLVFNVTTLASELTTKVTNAAKEIDTIISTNKSGLTFDKALEAFSKLDAAFADISNFNQVFEYDAALGKYIYTSTGLQKAIEAKENELSESATQLETTSKLYTTRIAQLGEDDKYHSKLRGEATPVITSKLANLWLDDGTYGFHQYAKRADLERVIAQEYFQEDNLDNHPEIIAYIDEMERMGEAFSVENVRKRIGANPTTGQYSSSQGLMADVTALLGSEDQDLLDEYESLAVKFMSSDKYKDNYTWDNFLAFIEEQVASGELETEAAQKMLDEYSKNKKNQYYSAIDWTKLTTGSDYTGANQKLVEALALELDEYSELVDEVVDGVATGKKVRKLKEGITIDWESVQNAYLDQLYGTDEALEAALLDEATKGEAQQKKAAKAAAKAAIKGQQKQAKSTQVSTAITEMLDGEGKVLTDTTIALMNQTEGLNISAADGVLAAGQDYVTAALALYEAHKDSLLSVAERNTAYASIITKKFAKSNQLITTLSSGTSLDIDALSTAFTTFGVELSDYYDASAENVQQAWMKKVKLEGGAEINNPFAGALETDIYGKTRITDWNKFVQGLGTQVDLSQYTGTFEYQNAYSSYVDGLITLQTQGTDLVKKQYDNAFSSITKYKQLNVSQMDQVDSLKLAAGGAGTLENGILKITDTVQYARNAIGLFSELSALPGGEQELYDRTGWTAADLAKNWKTARTILTQASDSWTSISENIMSLTDDNISTLMEKGGLKLSELNDVFTKVNDKYVINLTKYEEQLKKAIGEGKDDLTPIQQKKVDDAMISARAAIANKLTGVSWDKILNKTATEADWATFQNTMASSLVAMGLRLEDYYSWGAGGNVTLNLTSLRAAVESTNSEIGKQFNESLDKTIASLKDTGLSEISTAMEYTISGTDNQAAMREFAKRYKELTGVTKSLDELFTYDTNLQKYTLNVEELKAYQDAQKTYLESLGMSSTAVDQYIKDQTQQLLTAEMDISGFVTSKDLSATSKEAQTLVSQLKTWAMSFYGQLPDSATIDSWMNTLIGGGENAVELLKRIKGEKNVTADEITAVYTAATTRLKDSLELMSSEAGTIVDSYTASLFQNAGATVTDLGNGQYVIASIPNENWGIKIAAAYKQLYESLKTSAGATVTDLNNAYAKILESAESEQSNPIEAIANATSMTYTQLGEILAKEGIKLEDVIADQAKYGIESLGAGKIRIKDFTTFAEQMGWDTDTEEYVTAFKTYNDSLIELNRKTEKSILEEVKGLGDIKAGDKINLTTLWTKIQKGIKAKLESEDPEDYMAQAESEVGANSVEARYVAEAYAAAAKERNESYSKTLEAELAVYGATFKDGILTIGANADIQGIITKISSLAAENTSLLPNELAELADAIDEYISNLTSLIKSGLSGNLTNSNAQSLQAWADSQGLGKLDFTRTADGLKLSTQSAIELYNALKQIDALQAQLVFKELNSSLKETNENYKSVTSTMGRIKTLQGKIEELTAARSGLNAEDQKRTDAKINQYKEELALAKEILAARSTAEDDSFNFMSGKIPGAQNNPLNYAKNWTQALQTIRDAFSTGPKKAGKRGFIDYQDWYNIATEINNMAATTGQEIKIGSLTFKGDLESAAAAIQAGAESLTTVDTGDLKVNLASVGIGIKSGADALTSGITEGIQGVAKAQVQALDGLIAMLELIVSMEALGDIDVDSNGIDLSELFTVTTNEGTEVKQFNEAYAKWRKTMIDQLKLKKGQDGYNEDLQNALKGIKIGELSLADIIQWDEAKLLGADESVQKAYMAILSAFSKAAQSGNYDLDNIQESVLSVLSESGLTEAITLDIGDTTLIVTGGRISQVDWQAADAQEILKLIDSDLTEARKTATELISKYVSNQPLTTQELTYVLALQGNVTLENGEITSVTVGGHTYTDKSQFTAAMRAQVLEDQGVKVTQEEIEAAAKVDGGTVSTTVNMGKHTDIKVTSGEDGVEWWDGENGPYKSKQAMLDAAWEIFDAEQKKHEDQPQKTKDEYLYDEWNIRKKVTAKVTSGDEEITIDNDPAARAAIRNKIQQALTEEYQFNSEGNLDIDLGNGMKVTLSGDAVVSADGVTVDNNKVVAELQKMLGMDSALVDNISTAIGQAFQNAEIGSTLGTAIAAALTDSGIPLDNLTITPENISVDGNTVTLTAPIEEATGTVTTLKITATNTQADGGISNADIKLQLADAEVAVTIDKDGAVKDLETIASKIKEVDGTDPKISVTADTSKASLQLQNIINKLSNIVSKSITITTTYKENGTPPSTGDQATGNIGLASGNAFAQGTLMGELGPELVVSNGRYFVVGQQGPEMVNLAKDAIVFNHLQTKSLLEKGTSPDRGRAITNERNAVAFATGSRNGGPAMASAAAALAALKQLRAQWKALESLSAKDLAGKAGGGGGGGGKNAAFIKELERWYNLLQDIATLEQKITYEQNKRSKIQSSFNKSGKEYFASQKESLKDLEKEVQKHQQLADEQQKYFDKRRDELNNQSAFSELYTFDKNGQIKYKEGKFEELSKRFGGDSTTGKPNYSVKEQYDWLISQGYGYAMEYNENGEKIEIKDANDEAGMKSAIEAFWAKIDSDKSEMQELHDSIEEHKNAVLEKQQAQNELLKEIEDNQLAVEQKVLKAVEDAAKREIDELQDQKDAIQKGNEALISGLSEQLNKERQMYQNQESSNELESKRRRLAILQRSGGSASEIASLQQEIDTGAREEYFNKQQEQIDAIQEASDNEIEKLQKQIDIMNETLEYQKENGLLWAQVYEVMAKSPEEIADYIKANDSSYWGKSPADLARSMRDDLFEAEKWAAFAAEGVDIKDYVAKIAEEVTQEESNNNNNNNNNSNDNGKTDNATSNTSGSGDTNNNNNNPNNQPNKPTTYKYKQKATLRYVDDQYHTWIATGKGQSNKSVEDAQAKARSNALAAAKKTGRYRAAGNTTYEAYSEGGYDYQTGLAVLHGTPTKPEAVFNAEQTKILRDNILSNKPESLINLLKTYNEAYHGLSSSTYDSIADNSNSIVIEKAEVNMNVAKMNDKYDAKQAGKDVMRELLAISNKTEVRNKVTT